MTGTEMSHNSGIPASEDTLSSSGLAGGNSNMSVGLLVVCPWNSFCLAKIDRNLGLGLDSLGPVPVILVV